MRRHSKEKRHASVDATVQDKEKIGSGSLADFASAIEEEISRLQHRSPECGRGESTPPGTQGSADRRRTATGSSARGRLASVDEARSPTRAGPHAVLDPGDVAAAFRELSDQLAKVQSRLMEEANQLSQSDLPVTQRQLSATLCRLADGIAQVQAAVFILGRRVERTPRDSPG